MPNLSERKFFCLLGFLVVLLALFTACLSWQKTIREVSAQGGEVLPGLSWEAEEGEITSPFTVTDGYVYQVIHTPDPSQGGKAVYRFYLPAPGNYVIRAVIDAPNNGANSFFVNIDAEPVSPDMIWDVPLTSGFEERTVSWRGSGSPDQSEFIPKFFPLFSGEHELVIRGRESKTKLDKLSIGKGLILCSDHMDNDNDGLVDLNDIGCSNPEDNNETATAGELALLSLHQLEDKFNNAFTRDGAVYDSSSGSGKASSYYNLSYPFDGLLAMFEATGKAVYIEKGLGWGINMIGNQYVKDYDGDGKLDWANDDRTGPGYYLHHIKGSRPLARMVRIIKTDNQLSQNPDYLNKANQIQQFLEKNIIGRPGYGSTQGVHHIIAHELDVLLDLYLVTGNQAYYNRLVSASNLLKDTIFPNTNTPGAVVWGATTCSEICYCCYRVQGGCGDLDGGGYEPMDQYCFPTDSSHANGFITFAVQAYNNGVVFTENDIRAFTFILKGVIWQRDLEYVTFADFIDGVEEPSDGKYGGSGVLGTFMSDGWVKLGQYDLEVQYLMQRFIESGFNNWTNKMQQYGNLARNLKLMGVVSFSPGWNEIVWPEVSGKKASDVPDVCPIAVSKENFWLKPYVKNYGGEDFGFEGGRTYHLKCNQDFTWNLTL
jgi:hypothetical protein